MPGSSNLEEIPEVVSSLNSDPNIHGILVQSPAPDGVDELAIASSILPQKDGRIPSRQSWKTGTGAGRGANALYSVWSDENAGLAEENSRGQGCGSGSLKDSDAHGPNAGTAGS